MKKITIAIDGYSSCGKSTMAKDLAKEIGYVYAYVQSRQSLNCKCYRLAHALQNVKSLAALSLYVPFLGYLRGPRFV